MTLEQRPALAELSAPWDELVDLSPLPSPFLKSWWVDNAARGEPTILTCRSDDGSLVGGAAFEVDRVGLGPLGIPRVRVLGHGPLAPDHIDVLAAPGHRADVLAAVCGWLRSGNRIVDLDGLSADCEVPWLIDARLLSRQVAPYRTLESTDPVAELTGRLRSTIKRTTKRLAGSGFEPRLVAPTDMERALDTLFHLHSHRWADRSSWSSSEAGPVAVDASSEPGQATSEGALRRTLLAGLRCGGAVIHEMTDGSQVIASEIELIAGRRVAFYQAGRLTDQEFRGSGSALKAEVLRWAVREGMTEFDLLRGDDAYKDDWANARREVLRVRIGSGGVGRPAARMMDTWRRLAPGVARLSSRLRSGSP